MGLELDTGAVRAVQLRGTARKATVVVAGQVELPETAVVDGVVAEVGAVAEALERLWAEARISGREVVLGVPEQGALMRLAVFPKVPESKLGQVVRYQAGDYFPIPLGQLVLDHSVVGEVERAEGPGVEVLLVAARRDFLDKSLQALGAARLTPRVADAPALALLRSLPEEHLAGAAALVNIAHGSSSLVVVSRGVPRFARVMPISLQDYARERGCTLRDAVAAVVPPQPAAPRKAGASAGVERAAARAAGRAAPSGGAAAPPDPAVMEPAPALPAAVGEWGSVLAGEIRSSLSYFLAQHDVAVDVLVLSGRGARVPGLVEFLRAELDMNVEVTQPPAWMLANGAAAADVQVQWPDFAVSAGLALRGLEA